MGSSGETWPIYCWICMYILFPWWTLLLRKHVFFLFLHFSYAPWRQHMWCLCFNDFDLWGSKMFVFATKFFFVGNKFSILVVHVSMLVFAECKVWANFNFNLMMLLDEKILQFILMETSIYVQNFMTIHSIAVETVVHKCQPHIRKTRQIRRSTKGISIYPFWTTYI